MEASYSHAIHINALPDTVWMVLTNPDKIEQYMYGTRMEHPWEAGLPVEFSMLHEGEQTVFVKGRTIKVEPPFYLEYTVFPARSKTMEDKPENYLRVVYTITAKGNESELTVLQDDFSKVAEGENRYNSILKGWPEILEKIKAIAEKDAKTIDNG